jgi:hypothetical protein
MVGSVDVTSAGWGSVDKTSGDAVKDAAGGVSPVVSAQERSVSARNSAMRSIPDTDFFTRRRLSSAKSTGYLKKHPRQIWGSLPDRSGALGSPKLFGGVFTSGEGR